MSKLGHIMVLCAGVFMLCAAMVSRAVATGPLPPTPCHQWCNIDCNGPRGGSDCQDKNCKNYNHPTDPQIICVGCECLPQRSNPKTHCWCYR